MDLGDGNLQDITQYKGDQRRECTVGVDLFSKVCGEFTDTYAEEAQDEKTSFGVISFAAGFRKAGSMICEF